MAVDARSGLKLLHRVRQHHHVHEGEMAREARSGLKLHVDALLALALPRQKGGGSPFGVETSLQFVAACRASMVGKIAEEARSGLKPQIFINRRRNVH